jgi:CRP/FNR family transcriptional regulator, anaerobic regulatory protein
LLQEPSDVAVSAITACEVSRIKKKDLLEAAHESLVASHVCLYIAEQLFLSRARREKDLLTLSAEERYHALFEKSPEIIKFIPGNKIAKYLGIHPESLSRIKKNIIP